MFKSHSHIPPPVQTLPFTEEEMRLEFERLPIWKHFVQAVDAHSRSKH